MTKTSSKLSAKAPKKVKSKAKYKKRIEEYDSYVEKHEAVNFSDKDWDAVPERPFQLRCEKVRVLAIFLCLFAVLLWMMLTTNSNAKVRLRKKNPTFQFLNDLVVAGVPFTISPPRDGLIGGPANPIPRDDNSIPSGDCAWFPTADGSYDGTECLQTVSERILSSSLADDQRVENGIKVPLRWLFLGDSTMGMLFKHGKLDQEYISGKAVQDKCPSELVCLERLHKRCRLNQAFQFPPPTDSWWSYPDFTQGEGPLLYGYENVNCQDMKGMTSLYTLCHRKKRDSTMQGCSVNNNLATPQNISNSTPNKPITYGGYFSVEFARDVEIQTPDYDTTQENVASFLHDQYNSDPWFVKHFGGRPICVVSAGIHDMAIPNIDLPTFLANVEWYVGLLLLPCGHIVWLQNTSPSKSSQDGRYPQTQTSIHEWNRAVYQHLNMSQHLPRQRLTIVDVFEASQNHNHMDNIHLTSDWYNALGIFFKAVANEIIATSLELPLQ